MRCCLGLGRPTLAVTLALKNTPAGELACGRESGVFPWASGAHSAVSGAEFLIVLPTHLATPPSLPFSAHP